MEVLGCHRLFRWSQKESNLSPGWSSTIILTVGPPCHCSGSSWRWFFGVVIRLRRRVAFLPLLIIFIFFAWKLKYFFISLTYSLLNHHWNCNLHEYFLQWSKVSFRVSTVSLHFWLANSGQKILLISISATILSRTHKWLEQLVYIFRLAL